MTYIGDAVEAADRARMTMLLLVFTVILLVPTLFSVWAVWANRPTVYFIKQMPNPKTKQVEYGVCGYVHRWGTREVCPPYGQPYSIVQYNLYLAKEYAESQGRWKALP